MSVELTKQGFRVQGQLTFHNAAKTYHALKLKQLEESKVDIDLGGVSSSDSSALAVMLEWLVQAKLQKKTIEFVNIPDQLMLLIEMANLKEIFNLKGE